MDSIHQSFSFKEKHYAVCSMGLLISNVALHTKECTTVAIPCLYDHGWKKVVPKVDKLEKEDCFCTFKTKGTARKIFPGCVGILVPPRNNCHCLFSNCMIKACNASIRW